MHAGCCHKCHNRFVHPPPQPQRAGRSLQDAKQPATWASPGTLQGVTGNTTALTQACKSGPACHTACRALPKKHIIHENNKPSKPGGRHLAAARAAGGSRAGAPGGSQPAGRVRSSGGRLHTQPIIGAAARRRMSSVGALHCSRLAPSPSPRHATLARKSCTAAPCPGGCAGAAWLAMQQAHPLGTGGASNLPVTRHLLNSGCQPSCPGAAKGPPRSALQQAHW
jgi:hypothetical protein